MEKKTPPSYNHGLHVLCPQKSTTYLLLVVEIYFENYICSSQIYTWYSLLGLSHTVVLSVSQVLCVSPLGY